MDVVSLLPSATEICYALGVEPVGVSHECDHPPEAADVPAISYSVVDGEGSSASVNEAVATAQQEGNGVYAIDRNGLAAADPDVIVTQDTCDVCAVDDVLVEAAVADLDLDATVLTLDIHGLADLYDAIERIGRATNTLLSAESLVAGLEKRVAAVQRRAADIETRPRVAVLDWMDPVMVAGHWVPELVETASGRYGLEAAGARSEPREWAEIVAYDPEVLVVAPCGYELGQTHRNVAEVTDREGWDDVAAVRNGRAHVLDGHHYVNRPGPRLVDTLEHLAGLIHPDRFSAPPEDVAVEVSNTHPRAD